MSQSKKLRLDDQLCFALYAATNAVTRAYRPLLRDIGLTYPQYLAMMVLWQDGERPIREIAERLSLPPNALSPLIDRLEAQGLVTRRRDADDRRRIFVAPTATGSALEGAAFDAQKTVSCQTGLSHEQYMEMRAELANLAERIERELSELNSAANSTEAA